MLGKSKEEIRLKSLVENQNDSILSLRTELANVRADLRVATGAVEAKADTLDKLMEAEKIAEKAKGVAEGNKDREKLQSRISELEIQLSNKTSTFDDLITNAKVASQQKNVELARDIIALEKIITTGKAELAAEKSAHEADVNALKAQVASYDSLVNTYKDTLKIIVSKLGEGGVSLKEIERIIVRDKTK